MFASALRTRVNAPVFIDQGASSLCGAASFLYNLANRNPDAYASYIINLYEKGSAWIGHLHVVPGSDCKKARPSNIDPVDWVGLASLRDSSNAVHDYDSSADEVAGITGPKTMASWFGGCGYFPNTFKDTNLMVDKGLSTLFRAHQQRSAGGNACLLIGANIVLNRPHGNIVPDHWVVLTSGVLLGGKSVSPLLARGSAVDKDSTLLKQELTFEIYTWGGIRTFNARAEKFLDYFYGYVGTK